MLLSPMIAAAVKSGAGLPTNTAITISFKDLYFKLQDALILDSEIGVILSFFSLHVIDNIYQIDKFNLSLIQ